MVKLLLLLLLPSAALLPHPPHLTP